MAHAGWRGFRLLLLAAAVGVGLLAAAPEASASHASYWYAVELLDQRLACDGDSARITVVVTSDGSERNPVEGVAVRVRGNLSEEVDLPPTDAKGRTHGRITPIPGMSAKFYYLVGDVSDPRSPGPLQIGTCPFVPGPNTVDFDARFVDEKGRAIRGERASIQIGGYAGSTVHPHWDRSDRRGRVSWEGIPSFWAHPDDESKINTFCLGERSQYVFAGGDGLELWVDDRCVRGFDPQGEDVVFELRRN
jgi:hypothetical protein